MKTLVFTFFIGMFLFSGCTRIVAPAAVGKGAPPGQVQKATGYNPASGKVKAK